MGLYRLDIDVMLKRRHVQVVDPEGKHVLKDGRRFVITSLDRRVAVTGMLTSIEGPSDPMPPSPGAPAVAGTGRP